MRHGRANSALPVFDPISSLKTQYRPLRIIRDYFCHQNNILFVGDFKFICSPYIFISYITSRYLLFHSHKRGQNISNSHCFEGLLPRIPPNVEGFSVVPPSVLISNILFFPETNIGIIIRLRFFQSPSISDKVTSKNSFGKAGFLGTNGWKNLVSVTSPKMLII